MSPSSLAMPRLTRTMPGISGLFTVVVEPTPTWLAVAGLLAFTIVIVTLTALGIRRTEVEYSGD